MIYTWKAGGFVSKQGHRQPRFQAKARSLGTTVKWPIWTPYLSKRASSRGSTRTAPAPSLNSFRHCQLYLLSHKLLKRQFQICCQFHHTQDHFEVFFEYAWFSTLANLYNVHLSARDRCQRTGTKSGALFTRVAISILNINICSITVTTLQLPLSTKNQSRLINNCMYNTGPRLMYFV